MKPLEPEFDDDEDSESDVPSGEFVNSAKIIEQVKTCMKDNDDISTGSTIGTTIHNNDACWGSFHNIRVGHLFSQEI